MGKINEMVYKELEFSKCSILVIKVNIAIKSGEKLLFSEFKYYVKEESKILLLSKHLTMLP